jgi:hypothetical protein
MGEEQLTVILPCAGEGDRLGLKSPKELFEILPGIRLIDFSLDHILAQTQADDLQIKIKVAVVIRPWKREVVEHVMQKLPGIDVEAVLFNDEYSEWPGSVYSASGAFSGNNLVLLPDSCLRLCEGPLCSISTCFNGEGKTLLGLVLEALKGYKAVFGGVACTDPEVLKNLGAMRVEKDQVVAFQDKPGQDFHQFNSFWGCYAFRKESGKALYDFLIQSLHHRQVFLGAQPFYPVGAIPLHSYRDLGTWENINRFREGMKKKNR